MDFIIEGKVENDIYVQEDFPYSDANGNRSIILAGERLARAGEVVTPEKTTVINEYADFIRKHEEDAGAKRLGNFMQTVLLLGVMLWCFVFCLYIMRPHFFFRTNLMVLCGLLTFLHFGLNTWCFIHWQTSDSRSVLHLLSLLPHCLVPALTTLLLGTRISICLMLLLTSLTALVLEGEFQFVLF
ncbi:MAG: hypothetical protein J6X55_04815, partial [Victivallales bacterium]|nr:hypothetical protein [Victivallales bacterium]